MLKGKTYTLSYSGIFNKSGGECKGDTTFVSAYGKESQEPDNSGTVLINEIIRKEGDVWTKVNYLKGY